MRSHSRKQPEEATIDLTPMLDVVFIMLIFFIVTATFVKESGIDVFKTQTEIAELASKASVLVAIDEDNRIHIQQQAYDVDAVPAVAERILAENPKGTWVIQPDRNSDVVTYAKVHDALQAAGVQKIILATERT